MNVYVNCYLYITTRDRDRNAQGENPGVSICTTLRYYYYYNIYEYCHLLSRPQFEVYIVIVLFVSSVISPKMNIMAVHHNLHIIESHDIRKKKGQCTAIVKPTL